MPAKHDAAPGWHDGGKYLAIGTLGILSVGYFLHMLSLVSELGVLAVESRLDQWDDADTFNATLASFGALAVLMLIIAAVTTPMRSSVRFYTPFDKKNPNNDPDYHI